MFYKNSLTNFRFIVGPQTDPLLETDVDNNAA